MPHQQAITVCAFLYKENKIFIAKRAISKKFLPGKFELLGGHVEFGETMERALKREMMEEVSIEVTVHDPVFAFTYLSDNNTVHNIEVDYYCEMINPDQKITLNPQDHEEYYWLSEDEVDTYFDLDDLEGIAIKKGFAYVKKTSSGKV